MQAQPFGYTPTRKPLWASLRSKKNHISIINNYIYELKVESRSHSKKKRPVPKGYSGGVI